METTLPNFNYSHSPYHYRVDGKSKLRVLLALMILLLTAVVPVHSQNPGQRSGWYLRGSAGYAQISEQNINRLVNEGPSISGTISREFDSEEISQELKATLGIVLSKTSYEGKYRSVTPDLSLQYTLLARKETGSMTWRVGGFARLNIQDSYYPKLDQGRYYWSNFTGIGIHAEFSRPINDRSDINVGVELPVAGFISRPETERFFRIDELSLVNLFKRNFSNFKAATVNRIFNPTLSIAIVRQQGWIDRVGYEANYMSMKHPTADDFKRIDHRLFIKVKL